MFKTVSKAVNSLDQEILKHYSGIAKGWESRGATPYDVSYWTGSVSWVLEASIYTLLGPEAYTAVHFLTVPDRVHNIIGLVGSGESKLGKKLNNFNRNIRLTTLLSGAAVFGKAGVETMQYFVEKDPSFDTGIEALLVGTALFLRASSMYIKDRDYNLLKK